MTIYYRVSVLNERHLVLIVLEVGKFKIKVLIDSVFREGHAFSRNLPHPRDGPACPQRALNLTRFSCLQARRFSLCSSVEPRGFALNPHFHKIK